VLLIIKRPPLTCGFVGSEAGRTAAAVVCTAGNKFSVAEGGVNFGVQVGVTETGTVVPSPLGMATCRSKTSPNARSRMGYLPRVEMIWWKSGTKISGGGGGELVGEYGTKGCVNNTA
jgi:hypothetical protein